MNIREKLKGVFLDVLAVLAVCLILAILIPAGRALLGYWNGK